MKILHVITTLNVGGAETLVAGLCETSKLSGGDVELYVLRRGGLLENDIGKAGIPVHFGGPGSLYSPLHVLRLARFMKSSEFDVMHVHLYPAQLWVCLASWLAGSRTPKVTTEHGASNRRRRLLFRCLDRWMYRQFAAIAVISETTRNALLAHLGDRIPTICVVPNGIDPARFKCNLPRAPQTKTTAPVILIVGSLTRVKDQATAIRAIAQTDCAKLMLAGDGPLRGELEALASRLGVRSRVEFLGVRRDIPQLIASADLYVQTSRWEGFCIAVVEAMCGGVPCIVSRTAGLQETAGQASLYFEPGNADQLALAIRELSADPSRRAELADRGVEQASRFTLRACSARYEDFYRRTIQLAAHPREPETPAARNGTRSQR